MKTGNYKQFVNTTLCVAMFTASSLSSLSVNAEGLTKASPMNKDVTNAALMKKSYSPYAGKTYPMNVYWGDQHVHTGWSVDAGGFGATLGPEDALDFALGKEVVSSTGVPAKLARPLDWLVVSDHSDMAGTIFSVRDGDAEFMKDPTIKKWHDLMKQGKGLDAATGIIVAQSTGKVPAIMKSSKTAMNWWRSNTSIMEKYNDPGRFTAFIGYEWTSNGGGGDNLHRNIIYRDGKEIADQVVPMTTFDSTHPEDLWKWMDGYEKKTYGSILAIPHNGNVSNGLMFKLETNRGKPLTKEWIEARAKWEPLYEIVQYKGYSEAHPSLSPNDEFAAAEIWDKSNLAGVPKKPGMIKYEYVREALKNGLKLEEKFGTNPFKYGIVSGTDTHTALSAGEENNFIGKTAANEAHKGRWEELFLKTKQVKTYDWQLSAAGWTGVWAQENTRASLWDAMKRKETYGTTGPRISVRFFGGFDFSKDDAFSRHPAEIGYAKGVAMGGDLTNAPEGKSPTFLIAAMKDPLSGT